MIALALRDQIDVYASTLKTENVLFRRTGEGTLGVEEVAFYLSNIRELVKTTPRQLTVARRHAKRLGNEALAAHFLHKLGEEVGHDRWADDDLETLRDRVRPVNPDICASMRDLIAWIDATIDEDPVLHLAYMLFSEYLIVLLGPAWLELLEAHCDVPRSSMTVIDKHAELDRDHVDEAMGEIDRLVDDPAKLRRMREIVAESIEHFERFCGEVCDAESRRHAPAA
jgi:hypothetical protein